MFALKSLIVFNTCVHAFQTIYCPYVSVFKHLTHLCLFISRAPETKLFAKLLCDTFYWWTIMAAFWWSCLTQVVWVVKLVKSLVGTLVPQARTHLHNTCWQPTMSIFSEGSICWYENSSWDFQLSKYMAGNFKHIQFMASAFTHWYPNTNNIIDGRTKLIMITAGVFSKIVIPAVFFFSLSYCTETSRNRQTVSDTLQGCVWSMRLLFTIHHELWAASLISFTSSMRSDWMAAAGFIQPFTSNVMRDNDVPQAYSSEQSNQFLALAIRTINWPHINGKDWYQTSFILDMIWLFQVQTFADLFTESMHELLLPFKEQ